MRLILFILKCVVGLLASLGFLIVAGVVALAIWADDAQPWVDAEPEIPETAVLSFDLAGGVTEGPSDDLFSQLPLGDVLTLREAVEALVSLCVTEEVDVLLLAGDVFDGDWKRVITVCEAEQLSLRF